jgi:hypothetical protein
MRHICWLLIAGLALAQSPAETPKIPEVPSPGPVKVLWKDPGDVESLDFEGGPGGRDKAPKPPFVFLEEDDSGTNPKIKVKDAEGTEWSVKWGDEVNSENFASRIAWASGYFTTPMYFLPQGRISGAKGLGRAKGHIEDDGSFVNGRFQLRDPRIKFLKERSWSWNDNPFLGTPELAGLKIIVMLTSNWDNKDARDVERGTNTGILEYPDPEMRFVYLISDWGGSMGKWGGLFEREKWHSKGYAAQTPGFIKGVKDGVVEWGFQGQHTASVAKNITVSDVQWILQYVGRITDAQILTGLRASGATPEEIGMIAPAFRARIDQMRQVAGTGSAPNSSAPTR